MKKDYFTQQKYRRLWNTFQSVITLLNHRSNLQRLVVWASYKKLPYPLKLYQNRLIAVEVRLLRYRFQYPRLTHYTIVFHWLTQPLRSPPRYFPRGAAAQYRINRLTTKNRQTYSYTN